MKIKNLRLENFQGIKSARFAFDGESACIYGDNATGKTTVFNAVTWLLFDKPSTGAKNYTPKTKGANGDLHNLTNSAEASFIMDDGRIVTLRKDYHEVWKKKRGSATEEFDGHTVDFFIDGVPVKEKEYTSTIAAFCGGAETMKMLTMPDYFAEAMPWDQRRKILLEVCGDVSDDDVIAEREELEGLEKLLLMPGTTRQFYSVEEYRKIATAKRAGINKELQAIPNRIDEAQRAIPEDVQDPAIVDATIAALERERDALAERRAAILAGDDATAEAKKRTAEAEEALTKALTDYLGRTGAQTAELQKKYKEASQAIIDHQIAGDDAARQAADLEAKIGVISRLRSDLLEQYKAIQAETFDEGQETCPTCGQRLPEEKIEQLRSDFNLGRSQRLQAINERGRKEASETIITGLQAKAAAKKLEAEKEHEEAENCTKAREALAYQEPPKFETTEEYARLKATVDACRAAEAEAGNGTSAATAAVEAEIKAKKDAIAAAQAQKQKYLLAEAQRKRIAELEQREADLGAEYEGTDYAIYLCDEFTKAKIGMLTDRIDSKFKTVRFRLFTEQLNGGLKDDCEVLIPGATGRMVPYTFANNAARINAGLEIIDVLAEHWNISMPVFVDNAESITHIRKTSMQTIRLVVSEADKTLRLETESAE